ncbi:gephyrin-like molybdotransferase Glp [Paraliobacillus sediminis]|uniref:molybdopterin molybdotransferase MoeA n=1 Tax=Paraliobacillus sediminis TaxID=1885916 RepID=UPI000E3EAF3A|nr:gephyrin-like molybdotransferase Glp [Paraliobacillus sediminis]
MESRNPIEVSIALNRIMSFVKKQGVIKHVPIEQSYQRFVAEDIVADHDVPPFNRSPYDGYAIHASDTVDASIEEPIEIKVIGEIGAGSVFNQSVEAGQAIRIMTGAAIPGDCDAIIMLEQVKRNETKDTIFISQKVNKKENVSFQGEDTKKGETLVKKGTYITPGIIALLATFGYKTVPVIIQPKVGIIATGSELLEIDQPMEPGKIRNSNTTMLEAQIKRAGGEPFNLGQFSDDLALCFEQVKGALGKVDFLLTTGGVSVGDYDYLPEIYKMLGAEVLFNKVSMRPGSVTTVAEVGGKLLFGLSGNPSSCFVGFEIFTKPVIRHYLLADKVYPKSVAVYLGQDFAIPNKFDRFIRSKVIYNQGSISVVPSGLDKSNAVTSLAKADALTVLPGNEVGYKAGALVNALLLDDQEGTGDFLNDDEGVDCQ